jgi:hypothetical protein
MRCIGPGLIAPAPDACFAVVLEEAAPWDMGIVIPN